MRRTFHVVVLLLSSVQAVKREYKYNSKHYFQSEDQLFGSQFGRDYSREIGQVLECMDSRFIARGCWTSLDTNQEAQITQSGGAKNGKILSKSPNRRKITIIHFNDVYNIEPRLEEPIGGAARFVSLVKSFSDLSPLILFSGDAFNPSLMSTVTKGRQMVPVLNAVGVHVAAVGNHDLDFGVQALENLTEKCNFPWLMANVMDKSTGKILASAERKWVFNWNGVRVGIMGLVEREWLMTLATLDESHVQYIDFVEEGRKLVKELREQGAELIIALTHMRIHNDIRLASAVEGIDLVLGGHDHHYEVREVPPTGTFIFKSGTDFRELSLIDVELPPKVQNQNGSLLSHEISVPKTITYQRHEVTAKIKEDKEVQEVVDQYLDIMGKEMEVLVGYTSVALEGRFTQIRTKESNLCNFICDVFLRATGADVALLNAGTVRSDTMHARGELRLKDLITMLPMMDETCLLEVDGYTLLQALENGVSQYPKFDGRFPQVGGMRFQFDPSKPPYERVVLDSVYIREQKLDVDRQYLLATKEYLRQGKDGYDCLKSSKTLVNSEESPFLPTIVRNHFDNLQRLTTLLANDQHLIFENIEPELWSMKNIIDQFKDGNGSEVSRIGVWCSIQQRYEIQPFTEGRITTTVAINQ